MNFYSLLDEQRLFPGRAFPQTDTMLSARPSFLGGGGQMVPPPELQVQPDGRPPMTLPLLAQYQPANVPVPVSVGDLATSGGTDPNNLQGNPAMRPRFPTGDLPPLPMADVNRGLLGPGQEAPAPPPLPPQPDLRVPEAPRATIPLPALLDEPTPFDLPPPIQFEPIKLSLPADTGLLGEPAAAAPAKPSAVETNFHRLGAVAKEQQRQGSNMAEAPRLSVQAPTAGVGGRAVDLSAYMRQPLAKRSARKA